MIRVQARAGQVLAITWLVAFVSVAQEYGTVVGVVRDAASHVGLPARGSCCSDPD